VIQASPGQASQSSRSRGLDAGRASRARCLRRGCPLRLTHPAPSRSRCGSVAAQTTAASCTSALVRELSRPRPARRRRALTSAPAPATREAVKRVRPGLLKVGGLYRTAARLQGAAAIAVPPADPALQLTAERRDGGTAIVAVLRAAATGPFSADARLFVADSAEQVRQSGRFSWCVWHASGRCASAPRPRRWRSTFRQTSCWPARARRRCGQMCL